MVHFSLAEIIKTLFTKIHFLETGSNQRNVEEAAYMLFMDFIQDCEGKHDSCVFVTLETPHNCAGGEIDGLSLNAVLNFFMGEDLLPPSGFKTGAEMWFNPDPLCSRQHLCVLSLLHFLLKP